MIPRKRGLYTYMTMPSMATGSNMGMRTGGPKVSYGKSQGGQTPFNMQQFTPEQMQLFQQMFGHLGPDSFLGRLAGGDESMFKEMEAPAWRQFQGLQGQTASRFSGGETGNPREVSSRRSSGFNNTMNQASSDFSQALQSQRMGLQNQAIQDLMGMSNQLLGQRPNMQGFMKKSPSFWQQLLAGLGGAAGQFSGGLGGQIGQGFFGNKNSNQQQGGMG